MGATISLHLFRALTFLFFFFFHFINHQLILQRFWKHIITNKTRKMNYKWENIFCIGFLLFFLITAPYVGEDFSHFLLLFFSSFRFPLSDRTTPPFCQRRHRSSPYPRWKGILLVAGYTNGDKKSPTNLPHRPTGLLFPQIRCEGNRRSPQRITKWNDKKTDDKHYENIKKINLLIQIFSIQ